MWDRGVIWNFELDSRKKCIEVRLSSQELTRIVHARFIVSQIEQYFIPARLDQCVRLTVVVQSSESKMELDYFWVMTLCNSIRT